MPEIVVAAIDASLRNTAIVSGTSIEDRQIKSFPSKNKGESVPDRIARYEALAGSINSHLAQVQPHVITIEGYAYMSNQAGQMFIGEFGGILRWHLMEHTKEVLEIVPTTLKKFVTGKGNAKKEFVMAHLANDYHIVFDSNDEADAFALFLIGLCAVGNIEPRNQAQRDAVKVATKGRDLDYLKEAPAF